MGQSVVHIMESAVPRPGEVCSSLPGLFEFQRRKGWQVEVVSGENLQAGEAAIDQADLIHVHGLWGTTAQQLWPLIKKSPKRYLVSTYAMNMPQPRRDGRWRRLLGSLTYQNSLLRRAWCLHALTVEESNSLKSRRLNRRVKVLPFGVDGPVESEGTAGTLPAGLGGKRVVLYMGPLRSGQGLEPLLKACALLADRFDDLHVALVGSEESPWTKSLKASQRRRGFEDRLSIITAPSTEQVQRLLRGAMLLAAPIPGYCCPAGPLQAMAAGKPVMISPGCNLPEVQLRNSGWIVEPQRKQLAGVLRDAFERGMAELEKMGQQAREIIRDRYSWDRLGPEYLNLYARVLGSSP